MSPFVYGSPQFEDELEASAHLRGEVEMLRSITDEGMTAADVGANRGVTTLTLARAVGEAGRVWAFEPVPEFLATLEANLSRNRATNVQAHRLLIVDREGDVELYKHGQGSGIVPADGAERMMVEAGTFDGFRDGRGTGPVDVMNLDCEGSELLALRGAERTLVSDAPVVFCEVHHGYLTQLGQDVTDLVEYLDGLRYTVEPVSVNDLDAIVTFEDCTHILARR